MKLFFCKRGEAWWEGGLIIVASDEDAAKAFFRLKEGREPNAVQKLSTKHAGIIYDDDAR